MPMTQTRERGMIFSAEMVRRLLDGSKTQTRRIVKPQPHDDWYPEECGWYTPTIVDRHGDERPGDLVFGAYDENEGFVCTYGGPGDRLWVREAFDFVAGQTIDKSGSKRFHKILYKADGVPPVTKWTSSRYMPRWASRLTLEITEVRAQRVQDISAKDIISEGAVLRSHDDRLLGNSPISAFDECCYGDLKSLWAAGWDKIHGKGAWELNQWVWCITFCIAGDVPCPQPSATI